VYRNQRDPIIGTNHIDAMKLLNEDPDTQGIIMIGEIGEARRRRRNNQGPCEKACGRIHLRSDSAPGRRMGHAGVIVAGGKERRLKKWLRCRPQVFGLKARRTLASKVRSVT
jgi:succinyl-CoA synthetase alpha subunit